MVLAITGIRLGATNGVAPENLSAYHAVTVGLYRPPREPPRKQSQIAIWRGVWGIFGLRGAPMLDFGNSRAGTTPPTSA